MINQQLCLIIITETRILYLSLCDNIKVDEENEKLPLLLFVSIGFETQNPRLLHVRCVALTSSIT